MKTGIAAAAACVAWILPQIVLAAPEPSVTAAGLGGLLSAVSFCEKVDPAHGDQIRDKAKKMMKGLSEEKIESMRRSADFKKNYAAIEVVLDGIPKDDAVHMCTAASK